MMNVPDYSVEVITATFQICKYEERPLFSGVFCLERGGSGAYGGRGNRREQATVGDIFFHTGLQCCNGNLCAFLNYISETAFVKK
jgi:hypothetical protein